MFNPDIVRNRIISMGNDAVAVMGGAYWAAQEVHKDEPNFEVFIGYLFTMITHAKFFNWHESIPQAMRTFCHLCFVDPTLIEAYIGMKFEDICNE